MKGEVLMSDLTNMRNKHIVYDKIIITQKLTAVVSKNLIEIENYLMSGRLLNVVEIDYFSTLRFRQKYVTYRNIKIKQIIKLTYHSKYCTNTT